MTEACQVSFAAGVGDAGTGEPVLGLVHGPPGTGKSKVLKWLRMSFENALGWKHCEEFLCVAFQNRMLAAIGGTASHAGADMHISGKNSDRKSGNSEIYDLYIQSASSSSLRTLFSALVQGRFTSAARQTRYANRSDKARRIMWDYNLLMSSRNITYTHRLHFALQSRASTSDVLRQQTPLQHCVPIQVDRVRSTG